MPRYVIKGGRVVVEQGELRDVLPGALMRSCAAFDPDIEPVLRERFDDRYSVRFDSYPVQEPWLLEPARRVAGTAS